jgi:hypothetical protein
MIFELYSPSFGLRPESSAVGKIVIPDVRGTQIRNPVSFGRTPARYGLKRHWILLPDRNRAAIRSGCA